MADHLERNTRFHTTQWTQVLHAAADPELHTQLVVRYWSPIYTFLRSQGMKREEAVEATQAFVCDKLMQPGVFEHADPAKGKFRTFVIRVLKNYLRDQYRRERPRSRPVHVPLSDWGEDLLNSAEPEAGQSADAAFDREWARTIFSQSVAQLEESCAKADQQMHWHAFTLAHAEVFTKGITNRPTNEEIAERVGARDAAHVSILLNTVRRKYRQILEGMVLETLDSTVDGNIAAEIAFLRSVL